MNSSHFYKELVLHVRYKVNCLDFETTFVTKHYQIR